MAGEEVVGIKMTPAELPEAMEVLLEEAVRADAAVAREDSEFAVLSRQIAIGGQVAVCRIGQDFIAGHARGGDVFDDFHVRVPSMIE